MAASLTMVAAVGAAQERPATAETLAGNGVSAGEFVVEPPTLENLGFEWFIEGDANRNASVAVAYRRKGETTWRNGLPLLRLQGESTVSPTFVGAYSYVAPNMFAGSIFDLEPDTEYEARFTLTDSDGIKGDAVRTVTVRTRPEPKPAADGRTFHVYPFDYAGPKQEPAFKGLLQAYYMGSVGGDWYNAFPPRVKAGDVILVHAGVYKDQRWRYGHELVSNYTQCCNTTGDGTYYLSANGTAERPIVIKAAGDGDVVFDGDGNHNLFNVMGANWNYFEGITFRNTFIAFEAGIKRAGGASGLTIKNSKFEDVGIGVHTEFGGSKDFYVADNTFSGRHNPEFLMGWAPAWAKVPEFKEFSDVQSQFAIKIFGAGHVITHNRVRNFHDGIDHATYGDPDDYPNSPRDRLPVSIDILDNDISNVHDNCIEADGALHNIRVMRNLCTNSASQGYSLQPLMGGPAYFIRNVLYNSPLDGGIKFSEFPSGGIFYHNTWVSGFIPGDANARQGANMHVMNNLFLRQKASVPVFQMTTFTNYSTSDYNGFYAGSGADPFSWNSPDFGVPADFKSPLVKRSFATIEDYQRATGQDRHSVMIDFDIFERVAVPDPAAPLTKLYDSAQLDFRLKAGSAAVDKGAILPNINDGFTGTAPDLGALEFGQKLPHYGPRQSAP